VARQARMLLDGAFVDARENVLAFGDTDQDFRATFEQEGRAT
jgi:hypothetical protein